MGRVMPIPPSKRRVMGRVMGYCGGVANAPSGAWGAALCSPRGRVLSHSCNACPRIHTPTTHKQKRNAPDTSDP